jgi:hydrogenase maturation protein HypF
MATTHNLVPLRRHICVRGIVQGVGFRPFVYSLAQQTGITGFVLNTSSGVTIEAEGDELALRNFVEMLRSHPPSLAQVEEITMRVLEPVGDESFVIAPSQAAESEFALISTDVATCDDCLADFGDPLNRRFAYPFTNCTNCGPRYTIIQDIPYDRRKTTMAGFAMCADCGAEYHDPANRRFHAQPNACPACGPALTLICKGTGPYVAHNPTSDLTHDSLLIMREVRSLLHEGKIIAIKGLGGFQFACNARSEAAVRQLRQRKKRSDKPFALIARDLAGVEKFCCVSAADQKLLLSPARPIVILCRREGARISADVAPGNNTVGVMLAYTPLHLSLFADTPEAAPEFEALVMTSGNISDEPIVTSNEEAWERLSPVADWFLFHDRDIYMRVDDAVARNFEGKPRILRRSRGYVPQPIRLNSHLREVLACGGELKNTFCLTKGNYAILSQHIGDVENYETVQFFHETLTNLKKLFRVEPQAVAHDLHPLYRTSRLAAELPLRKIAVQHHHAHVASCMAENGLRGKVIGVAFDGTGYGTDAQIWGGEFLTADFLTFERRAHFRYVPLAGGDAAVRQPWRSALSWLREAFASGLPGELLQNLPLFRQVPKRSVALVSQMMDRRVNTVLTSSCGRLFDAVASLIGLRQEATFEGQAAIELEIAAQSGIDDRYSFNVEPGIESNVEPNTKSNAESNTKSNAESNTPAQIDMRPMIREIVRDILNHEAKGVIASRFHNTIAAVTAEICHRIRETGHLNRVCLSGGTFQNIYLLGRTSRLLREQGFEVFLHARVPPNDGGIALGQAVIANEILANESAANEI